MEIRAQTRQGRERGDDEGSGLDALKHQRAHRAAGHCGWVSSEVIQFPSSFSISRLCEIVCGSFELTPLRGQQKEMKNHNVS